MGECIGDGFYLTPAFPSWSRRNELRHFSDNSRFLFSIRVERPKETSIRIETYEWLGEEISALLGAFYGKLIINLGHIQSGRSPRIPNSVSAPLADKTCAPFNSEARKPDGPALNLFEARSLIERFVTTQEDERLGWIMRATEFYRIALENFRSRPEIVLAMFCSTLEALLPLRAYSEAELYDNTLASLLARIVKHCPKGDRIVRGLKSRLFQIKRRVAAFVEDYVPDSYFEQREAVRPFAVVRDRADLIVRIKSVYDLRSKVLHTGDRSGLWYLEHDQESSEIGLGTPVMDDERLKKVLVSALTLTGLERIVSTILRAVIKEWLISTSTRPQAP